MRISIIESDDFIFYIPYRLCNIFFQPGSPEKVLPEHIITDIIMRFLYKKNTYITKNRQNIFYNIYICMAKRIFYS